MDAFGEAPVVVKPSGLTGGKGVKVMGPHLASHERRGAYARSLLARGRAGESVLIEEKIVGAEFTIQADQRRPHGGVPAIDLRLPLSLRRGSRAGHRGHGLADARRTPTLPFMTPSHYDAGVLDHRARDRAPRRGGAALQRRDEQRLLRHRGGRQGDRVQRPLRRSRVHEHHEPVRGELDGGDGADLRRHSRRPRTCALREEASVVLYLVSPDYALAGGADRTSSRSTASAIEGDGARVFFSSAEASGAETLPHGRHLPRRRARRHRTDARAGARAGRVLRRLGAVAGVAPRRRRRGLPRSPPRARGGALG